MTGPKITVSADTAGVRRELESLDRTVQKINGHLNSGEVGIDTEEAQRDLSDLERQAKSLGDALENIRRTSPLSDIGAAETAAALALAAKTAQTLETALRHTGGPSSGLSAVARQARDAEEGLRRATRAQDVLGREGINLTRKQAQEAKKSYDALRTSGARGTRRLRDVEFDDWASDGWRNHSLNSRESQRQRDAVLRRLGVDVPAAPGSPSGGGRSPRVGGGKRGKYGAVMGAMGGVASGMMGGGDGGLWGAAGNAAGTAVGAGAGFMLGGPMGAAVGAMAGQLLGGLGSALDAIIGKVSEEGSIYTDLRQSLGSTVTDFDLLRGSVRHFTDGLGIAYNEAAKLASEFARTAAMSGADASRIGPELGAAIGFGRGYGLAPEASVQFMAQMRHTGVTRDVGESRRLALMIGEAVNRGGIQVRMGEALQAIQSYTASAARQSLSAPDAASYAAFMSSMTGLNLYGLKGDPGAAAASMGQADAALRQGGAFGEASKNFSLGLWQRMMPGFNSFDMDFVNEQGAFGSVDKAFGRDSAAYQFAAERGDKGKMAAYDRMAASGGGRSMLEHQMRALEQMYGGDTDEFRTAIQAHLGVGAGQATALYRAYRSNNGLGGLEASLRSSGVDIDKLDTRQVASLASLAGADSGALGAQADKLLALKGDKALSKDERDRLSGARGNEDSLRDAVLSLSATHNTTSDQGDQLRNLQVDMNNALQKLATELIPLTMWIKDGIVEMVRALPGQTDFMKRYSAEQTRLADEAKQATSLDTGIATLKNQIGAFKEDSPAERQSKVDSLLGVQKLRNEAAARGDTGAVAGYDETMKQLQDSIRGGSADGRSDLVAQYNQAVVQRNGIESKPATYAPMENTSGSAVTPASVTGAGSSGAKGRGQGALSPDELAYLSETDRLLGAPDGTSAAQIMQESGGNNGAVSSAGARGLAQLMPTTKASLEARLGRRLNGRQDQLLAHRMLMQENLDHFGNLSDAQKAYNSGWDRDKWGNPETAAYVGKIEAGRAAMDGQVPAGSTSQGGAGQNVNVTVGVAGQLQVVDGAGRPTGQQVPLTTTVGAPRPQGQ